MPSDEWLRRAEILVGGNCDDLRRPEDNKERIVLRVEDFLAHQIACFFHRNVPILREKRRRRQEVRVSDFSWCPDDCPAALLYQAGRGKNGHRK